MIRLHLGDHAELPEALEVIFLDDLSVDQAKAAVAGPVPRDRHLEPVEQRVDRQVADGVHLRDQADRVGGANQLGHPRRLQNHGPPAAAVVRLVIVGRPEAGARVPHDAVDEPLQASDLQHLVAEAGPDAERGQFVPLVERRARVDADAQLAAIPQTLKHFHLRAAGDVVDPSHAVLGQPSQRGAGLQQPLLERFRRYDLAHPLHRRARQDAGRFAGAGVALDGTAGRIRGRAVDPGPGQRDRVGQVFASVPPAQQHRRSGRQRIDHSAVRLEA